MNLNKEEKKELKSIIEKVCIKKSSCSYCADGFSIQEALFKELDLGKL